MRPTILNTLFSPVLSLKGIGPKVAGLIARTTGREQATDTHVVDMVFHLPHSLIDRSRQFTIVEAPTGDTVTLKIWIDEHKPSPRGRTRAPYKVFAHDNTEELTLVFFNARQSWLEGQLPVGEEILVSGKLERFNDTVSMVHPDYMVSANEPEKLPKIEPIYPSTAGLSQKVFRKGLNEALKVMPDLPEWQDKNFVDKRNFTNFKQAVNDIHLPSDMGSLSPNSIPRERLAYDELFANQLSLALVRNKIKKLSGDPIVTDGALRKKIQNALPFILTQSQSLAVDAIISDIQKPERMLRLLQGDVGSGKTAVAMLAIMEAVDAGGQAVLMAPTELLANQHLATLTKFCEISNVRIALLTGKIKGKKRREIEDKIENGEVDIIIGTHALFQDGVNYKNLTLAIVDEQHRFGVHQRLRLTAKGQAPHMLVMTATPIPRTLVLSAFGDMDVSKLTEKPAGRKPIQTVILPQEKLGSIIRRLNEVAKIGKKAYWVCPLVEESEVSDLMSAQERHQYLQQNINAPIGLIHGRMTPDEKDAAMTDFKSGVTKILVATTVIEVGVDVPDATIMVIEHAERFGLAQLHQLRGRIGRGDEASSCVLLYKGQLSQTAQARLNIMRDTEDGFKIAEEDLKLRGEGEVLGTRQSGTPGFKLASLEHHGDLVETARNDARYIIEIDPDLVSERGKNIRILLYLMRRDEAIKTLRAG